MGQVRKCKCQGRSQKKQKGKEFMFNTITKETLWMPDYNKRLLEQNKEKQPEPPTSPSPSLMRKYREYKKWQSSFIRRTQLGEASMAAFE